MDQEFKFMIGTGGQPDYLMIARKGEAALGIKPLSAPIGGPVVGMIGVHFGLRVRVASLFGAEKVIGLQTGAAPPTSEKTWTEAFPNIEFSAINDKRGSLIVGLVIRRAPWQVVELRDRMSEDKVVDQLLAWVVQHTPGADYVVPAESVKAWLTDHFNKHLDGAQQNYACLTGDTTPVGTMGEVLPMVVDLEAAKETIQKMAQEVDQGSGAFAGEAKKPHLTLVDENFVLGGNQDPEE